VAASDRRSTRVPPRPTTGPPPRRPPPGHDPAVAPTLAAMAIAELLGRDVTTLQRWIQLACTQSSRLFCDNVVSIAPGSSSAGWPPIPAGRVARAHYSGHDNPRSTASSAPAARQMLAAAVPQQHTVAARGLHAELQGACLEVRVPIVHPLASVGTRSQHQTPTRRNRGPARSPNRRGLSWLASWRLGQGVSAGWMAVPGSGQAVRSMTRRLEPGDADGHRSPHRQRR
jgi:hypothetical protein